MLIFKKRAQEHLRLLYHGAPISCKLMKHHFCWSS